MAMNLNLRDLFGKNAAKTNTAAAAIPVNSNEKRADETYRQYGMRMCTLVSGSNTSLKPFLHNVYICEYKKQLRDEEAQERERDRIRREIEQKQNDLELQNRWLDECREKQTTAREKIRALQNEKNELRNRKYEENREARIKLRIGLGIVLLLTAYLFLFYSSTFYSAFFRSTDASIDLMGLMFDPQALSQALQSGIPELCFVLLAPVIFIGLGFSLHFFSVQKSAWKYLKMAAIIAITFVFDAILAYKIGEYMYNLKRMYDDIPPFTLSDAVVDINTWAVIFCGFVVYIIWGIVFDMTMTAYNELDMNRTTIRAIDKQITDLNGNIRKEEAEGRDIRNRIDTITREIGKLRVTLEGKVIISIAEIQAAMSEFFTGWSMMLGILEKDVAIRNEANTIFADTVAILLNQNPQNDVK